ncbi:zinc-finger-containing protein [Geomicrobium sediminis]|uniref:zinc-finger-containing protein n=1 Tax=Geomicrobium sediminis TaxID=1347788 RepID=UPI003B8384E6
MSFVFVLISSWAKCIVRVNCSYCFRPAKLIKAKELHPRKRGWLYICYNCKAHVGCHRGTREPLGYLATKDVRRLRHRCHKALDPIWQSQIVTRSETYEWVAKVLNLPAEEAHIGKLNKSQCQKLLVATKQLKYQFYGLLQKGDKE